MYTFVNTVLLFEGIYRQLRSIRVAMVSQPTVATDDPGRGWKKLLAHWRGDLMGGLTAAVVALPLALAFAIASGVDPKAGLYTSIVAGCVELYFAKLTGEVNQISPHEVV